MHRRACYTLWHAHAGLARLMSLSLPWAAESECLASRGQPARLQGGGNERDSMAFPTLREHSPKHTERPHRTHEPTEECGDRGTWSEGKLHHALPPGLSRPKRRDLSSGSRDCGQIKLLCQRGYCRSRSTLCIAAQIEFRCFNSPLSVRPANRCRVAHAL